MITGAASGLAAGVAPLLARNGFAHVAITFRTTLPDETLAAIRAADATASAHQVDFLDDELLIEKRLAAIVKDEGPFDTLVHAVGPLIVKRFVRLTPDECREMIDGNFKSAVLAARAVLPHMRERRFGRLVFFGANGSSETRPARGFSVYVAAKSAVVAFARTLALEEAQFGITVNVIEPGDIREKSVTRDEAQHRAARNPRGRLGSFEDVADVVRFLVEPERDFVTGAVIGVTGGLWEADERNAPSS